MPTPLLIVPPPTFLLLITMLNFKILFCNFFCSRKCGIYCSVGSNVLQCKNQARPLCCITDEDADYYAVFIQTLVNPVVTNCNTVDTQLDSLIDYNATTESLHNLIMYVCYTFPATV